MRVIFSKETSPYFNLASEEYLLENCKSDVFMLWRNEKSVIIGKNQNAYSEVNLDFCEKNSIGVVRRLTGGGAVFHDPGNVNFTFICDFPEGGEIDFSPFLDRVTKALSHFGIDAYANGRNDIEAAGSKISGNAQCRYNCADGRVRLLHHGTLLFSADMDGLAGALNVRAEKMESKGIKSVRSRVCNIRDIEGYCGPDNPIDFALELSRIIGGGIGEELSAEEKAGIQRLCEIKYSTWEWNIGRSPRFSCVKRKRFPYGIVEIAYTAKGARIEDVAIRGDFFALADIGGLEEKLRGASLEREALEKCFADANRFISGSEPSDLSELILND